MQVQTQAVRLPLYMLEDVKKRADAEMRSVPKHIEYYYKLARCAMDNPDLPMEFIIGALEAKKEIDAGNVSLFEFRYE